MKELSLFECHAIHAGITVPSIAGDPYTLIAYEIIGFFCGLVYYPLEFIAEIAMNVTQAA